MVNAIAKRTFKEVLEATEKEIGHSGRVRRKESLAASVTPLTQNNFVMPYRLKCGFVFLTHNSNG